MTGRGLGALVLVVLAGCLAPDRAPRASSGAEPAADDGTSEGGDVDGPGFDPQDVLDEAFDYRNTMNQVNDAPEPATHGDAERVNYFAAPGNESLFRTIDPALTDQQVTFSEGAMFVKEHLDPDGAVVGFTVMRKARPGYDPDNGDWWWARVSGDSVTHQGTVGFCAACHLMVENTDYVYGIPLDNRR